MNQKEKNIDFELIERLNHDDHESFRKLFEQYSKPLFLFSLKYLKSAEAAEDIVQEVFLKIWDKRKNIKSDTCFKSYLFTIVLNSIRKYFNRLSRYNDFKYYLLTESANDVISSSEPDEYSFLLKKMEDLISVMPEKRKEVIIKKKIEKKTLKEIAEDMEITTKTVEYHITEGMKFLKKEFKKITVS